MAPEYANQLVDFLEDQAGDTLRGAVHYTKDDYEVIYLRDDVEALYPDEKLEELFQYYRRRNAEKSDPAPFDLGNRHCSVACYDDAILFHFTQGESVGTVITLDPEAGRDMLSFITDCLEQLHYNSPQEIDNAPVWAVE